MVDMKKTMYFKEQSYKDAEVGKRTTTTFNNIILNTTAKELSSEAAVQEFMNIAGWKARRSGKCGLTMVNVTDCADVNMGLGSFKFSLCHWNFLLVSSIGLCKSDNSILSDITGKCK